MFTIRAIELRNWDYWKHIRIPLDTSIVMLTGPNGSGKTTVLDAIRIILNTPRLSHGRKSGKYIRDKNKAVVIKAVVTNTPIRGRRPFASISLRTDEVTLACILKFKGGAPVKYFLVLPGDADMEKIEREFEENNIHGSDAYSDILNKAGMSKSLLNIFTLEQGDTNKLCSKSPQDLFNYVMEIKGNQIVLNQYNKAKINYGRVLEELGEQRKILLSEQNKLAIFQRDKVDYEAYESFLNEKNQLENVDLPLANYKEKRAKLEETETEIKTQRGRIEVYRKNIQEIEPKIDETNRKIEFIEEKIKRLDAEVKNHYDEKSKLDILIGENRTKKRELEEIKIDVEKIEPKDIVKLKKEYQELQKILTNLNIDKERKEKIVLELKAELEELGKGITPYHPYIRDFLDKLKEVNIPNILLADVIEIVDEKWRYAIESLLGWNRFTIIVDPENSIKAREIGQRFKYYHYISEPTKTELPVPKPGSVLEKIHFLTDKIPLWIIEILNNTALVGTIKEGYEKLGAFNATITPDAYKQDIRGGISLEAKKYYCGQGGRKERIKISEKKLIEEQEIFKEIEKEIKILSEKILIRELEIAQQEKYICWEETEKQKYQELLEILNDLETKSAESLIKIGNVDKKIENERASERTLRDELSNQKYQRDRNKSQLEDTNNNLNNNITKYENFYNEIEIIKSKFPEEKLQPENLSGIFPVDSIKHSLEFIRARIEGHKGCKDKTIKDTYEKHYTKVQDQEAFVEKRQKEVEEGEAELKKCRADYIKVIRQVVWNYRTNASKLAKMAKADLNIEIPNLSEEDESVDHAGLEIAISFDGKAFTPIGDPDLSGGQQVIVSLILLMSLADLDEDDSGFFILDEPFAHLSIERIDEVTRFLQASKAQYILTTPSTHNINIYTPVGLILTLFKKKQGETYAPLPAICRGK